MDIVKMLRSYAKREDISAMDRSLMLEAAERLEKYEQEREELRELEPPLKNDKILIYGAMKAIEDDAPCGMNMQDTIVYSLCKAVYDIIEKIEKEDK